jgi:hypothetical protein
MTTSALIASIRQEIATGCMPTEEVLLLCDKAQETLNSALRLEKALHEALKVIEQRKSLMTI